MVDLVRVHIGMGGNLADSLCHLVTALDELAALAPSGCIERSALYRTAPMGPAGQPDYLNAAVRLETDLRPLELLDALQTIEGAHGRVRSERWGPRTLDLDLLTYGSRRIVHPRLRVPHPGLAERMFVVRPLLDLGPDEVVPGVGALRDLARSCPPWTMERVPWPALGAQLRSTGRSNDC